ncbi:MAG: hypothetical protein QM667_00220, partial [Asticcacaulis sp.]
MMKGGEGTTTIRPYDLAFILVRLFSVFLFVVAVQAAAAGVVSVGRMDSVTRGTMMVLFALMLGLAFFTWFTSGWWAKRIAPSQPAVDATPATIEIWQALGIRLFGFYIAYAALARVATFLGLIANDMDHAALVEGVHIGQSQ